MTCTARGCPRRAHRRCLCWKHYDAFLDSGLIPRRHSEQREHVARTRNCWFDPLYAKDIAEPIRAMRRERIAWLIREVDRRWPSNG